ADPVTVGARPPRVARTGEASEDWPQRDASFTLLRCDVPCPLRLALAVSARSCCHCARRRSFLRVVRLPNLNRRKGTWCGCWPSTCGREARLGGSRSSRALPWCRPRVQTSSACRRRVAVRRTAHDPTKAHGLPTCSAGTTWI